MKIWKIVIVSGLACLASISAARAQAPATAIQQMENSQRQMELQKPQLFNANTNAEAPELFPGENTDIGPQRILKMIPRKKWFEVTADSMFFYTENAYLSDSQKQSSTIFVNTIQAAFSPDATSLADGQFAPGIGFRSQWFNYDLGENNNLSRLDFDAQTAFVSAKYTLKGWQFYGELDYTRLLSQASYNEVYHEFMPVAGIRRMFVINDKAAFTAGYQIAYHATEIPALPSFSTNNLEGRDVNDRLDNTLAFSFAYLVSPKLIMQPFYRIQYTYYPGYSDNSTSETGRNDLLNDFGATLIYQFNKNFAARAFVDYQVLNSDYKSTINSVGFHNLNAGAGVTLDFRF